LKFLKKQVEKIEKTIEMREQLKNFYLEYFKREDEYIKVEKARLVEEKRVPLAELSRLEQELKQAKEILSKSESKDIKSDEIMRLESELRETRLSKDLLVRETGRIEGEISYLDRQYKKQLQAATSVEAKKVDLSSVESMINLVSAEIETGANSEDLSLIKNTLSKIKGILLNFINENKAPAVDDSHKETEQEISALRVRKEEVEKELVEIKNKEGEFTAKYNLVKEEIEKEKDSNRDAEKAVFRIMAEQNEINTKLAGLQNREERLMADENNFKQELTEAGVLVGVEAVRYKDVMLEIVPEERVNQEERRKNIERLKIRIEDAGIGSSDEVLREYRDASERDTFLEKELVDLGASSVSLQALIKELDDKLTTEFKIGVEKINTQFQEFFSKMFGGGTAKLSVIREIKKRRKDTDMSILESGELGDEPLEETRGEISDDEISEGIDIEVNLPKKKIKGLMMLSGGERALTSIALLFAMSQVNPPPFIILDETDAALDEANSKKYGDMITELSKYSQLILVTHNRETMSRAGIIYGVTMGMDGISKLLSIQFDEAVQVAK
jgi:chromosome segregation protein